MFNYSYRINTCFKRTLRMQFKCVACPVGINPRSFYQMPFIKALSVTIFHTHEHFSLLPKSSNYAPKKKKAWRFKVGEEKLRTQWIAIFSFSRAQPAWLIPSFQNKLHFPIAKEMGNFFCTGFPHLSSNLFSRLAKGGRKDQISLQAAHSSRKRL